LIDSISNISIHKALKNYWEKQRVQGDWIIE
jgi:hypothetical protein